MELLFFLIISLVFILVSCIIFTNSVEWLGARLNLSHGITGSILAAVGTALPETVVPLVAIFWGITQADFALILKGDLDSLSLTNQISIGAIIGAPFMLSTIAFFLVGLAGFVYKNSGRRKSDVIAVDKIFLERDLKFFILSFTLAFVAVFLSRGFHLILGMLLICFYGVYLYETFTKEKDVEKKLSHEDGTLDPLLIARFFPDVKKPTLILILLQLVISLGCLIYSAHHFVEIIKEISYKLDVSPFIISLLLTPIATELPEKFNSWLWMRQKQDILAVGNISGALVFQSTFPVTVGLLFTSWTIKSPALYLCFVVCLVNALFVLIMLKKKELTYKHFLCCGVLYLVYLVLIWFWSTLK